MLKQFSARFKKKDRSPAHGGYTLRNRIKPVRAGKHFFDLLLKLVSEANDSVHIQTYAFDDDATGTMVADALIEAAQRKVEVYVLADGFASQGLSAAFIRKMLNAGIHFRHFEPMLKSKYFYFGRRLHHKIVVVDNVKALVGSMNIADRYNDREGEKSWLDVALYVEGEAAVELQEVCWRLWLKKKRKNISPGKKVRDFIAAIPEKEHTPVRIRQNDWVMQKIEISKSYYTLFGNAKHTIYIMCSYFLPGKRMLRYLKQAGRRGVKIHVVLAGTSDVKTAKFAERYLYRWLLRNNMNIYEYQPTVLHAKTSIADGQLFTIGSYNLNGLSAYASIELNLDVKDEKAGHAIEAQIKKIIKEDSKPVDPDTYVHHLFHPRQLLLWLSYQFMNFMLTITTFYFRQKE
ncbi:MAG: phosphatidylserine/phosphatidylglycerophosphate/cardiolipin synthase family protein [Chitinophagaceae bacterium]